MAGNVDTRCQKSDLRMCGLFWYYKSSGDYISVLMSEVRSGMNRKSFIRLIRRVGQG